MISNENCTNNIRKKKY